MTDNHDKQPTTRRNTGQALALGAILLGLLCIVAGIWLLNWRPKETAVAAVTPEPPTSTPVAETVRPVQAVMPTATDVPPPTPTATPATLQPGLFHLAIVHSNDTWGYLMPCG